MRGVSRMTVQGGSRVQNESSWTTSFQTTNLAYLDFLASLDWGNDIVHFLILRFVFDDAPENDGILPNLVL